MNAARLILFCAVMLAVNSGVYLVAKNQTEERLERNAVELGVGRYNPKTRAFELLTPEDAAVMAWANEEAQKAIKGRAKTYRGP